MMTNISTSSNTSHHNHNKFKFFSHSEELLTTLFILYRFCKYYKMVATPPSSHNFLGLAYLLLVAASYPKFQSSKTIKTNEKTKLGQNFSKLLLCGDYRQQIYCLRNEMSKEVQKNKKKKTSLKLAISDSASQASVSVS